MLKPQKKMSKKELKEDKFVYIMMQVRAYVDENTKLVTILSGALLVLVIAFLIFNYNHSQTVQKSSTLLGEAQVEYQNLNYSKAEVLLKRLLEEYGGTEAAGQGQLLLANIYYQNNKTRKALEQFEAFITSYDGSNMLLAAGYAGYAACLERQKEYDKAAENYLKAQSAASDFVEAPDYLYLAALNFISAGNYASARNALTKLKENYKNSAREKDAEAKLILIANK